MVPNDGGEGTKRLDDSAALSRRGILMETVAASIAEVLNATSVTAVLPAVLTELAKVVRIDRLVIVEAATTRPGAHPSSLSYVWNAPGTQVSELIAEQINSASAQPALQDWFAPLTQGKPVVTVRRTAAAAV